MKANAAPSILGEVVMATGVVTAGPSPRRARNIILLLAGCVALMMTGYGIIMPVFARRFGELGSGVGALGIMTMSFALAQFISAPIMGALADRFGRRPQVLLALAAFACSNVGFLLAQSTLAFILVRAVAGALSAGLFPSAMGIVADIVPPARRARWVGIVMGSYGAGFIFGPLMGGLLYDQWGFEAPFILSAALAFAAFVAAAVVVPETRPRQARQRAELRQRRTDASAPRRADALWDSLPRPLYVFGTLLCLDFINSFTFAFVEPEMVFYFYEELYWSTAQFGLVVGIYGLSMVLGQTMLGQASDRFGRKPITVLGLFLGTTFYLGLMTARTVVTVSLAAAVSGLGAALLSPALSAFYLDITAERHRARILGLKGSAVSLGGVTGPLLVAIVSPLTTSQVVFCVSAVLLVLGAALAFALLKEPRHSAARASDIEWEIASQRAVVAQAAWRGVALRARLAREARNVG
jgi:DHA1 family tetracycline resistance protein-like MFS transporter